MAELDRIRTPKRARYFRLLTIGVAVVLGCIASLEWWLAGPGWRLLVVLAVSAAIGFVAGRIVFRRKMFKDR